MLCATAAGSLLYSPPAAYCNPNSKFPCLSSRISSFILNSPKRWRCRASLITTSDSFEVGALVGSYGFMNVTRFQSGSELSYSPMDLQQLKVQDVGEGSFKIKLYEGRVAQGSQRGTPVLFKVYPGQRAGGIEADMMAANELSAHSSLQSSAEGICKNLVHLIGGFETKTGEQWLAFRNHGKYSAADYAALTSKRISQGSSSREKSWNSFQQQKDMEYRRYFVIRILQGAISGLAFMHDHDRLHQSLGPSSLLLNTISEKDAGYLIPRLRDLTFSVDMSFDSISNLEGARTLSESLWRRATAAGAFTALEKRAFGIADDICFCIDMQQVCFWHTWRSFHSVKQVSWIAFLCRYKNSCVLSSSLTHHLGSCSFVDPFICPQRLLENTFKLDLEATREYCLADDRLEEAVKFLDIGNRSGWELLQAMLNPDFRQRPTAKAVLNHSFMSGSLL
ncbi:unnamed protein product [Linum tenue]|uniref:Protein kinase domain-containing protein n=1 Tax=Linum tenue TaxID=586396 RepID=A0AAV0QRK7_9ROSI|nr:unnamed protein product [Linum tenue]CAI0547883.1 unnamed protein product [Linum tenue]